jgi:hypothetical protein
MKKIVTAIAIFFISFGLVNAQTAKPKTDKTKTKTETKTAATDTKVVEKAKTTKPAPLTKKDGTADMRFKANKEKAKTTTAAGPTKKDGTADMRFKANKDKTKAKTK